MRDKGIEALEKSLRRIIGNIWTHIYFDPGSSSFKIVSIKNNSFVVIGQGSSLQAAISDHDWRENKIDGSKNLAIGRDIKRRRKPENTFPSAAS